MSNIDNSLDILKMEYQVCRNKIDDLDNFLKEIRFKGITINTGFIGGTGSLLNLGYWDAAIILSIATILLIFHLWVYDHKYSIFLVGAVKRAKYIEKRLEEKISEDGGKRIGRMLSQSLSEEYIGLPSGVANISSSLYSLLIIIGLGILLYSTYLKQIFWLSVLIGLISIIFIFIMFYLWHLRAKVEPRFRGNSKKRATKK